MGIPVIPQMLFCLTTILSLIHVISSQLSLTNTDLISGHSSSIMTLNQYEADGESYWKSLSYFQPVKNSSYGTITVKNSFYMKFNLWWHGFSTDFNDRPYESVFRIGIPSTLVADCNGHATRYPALYLDKKSKALQFSISDNTDCWGVGLLNISYTIHPNTLYTITIQYNNSWVIIQINDYILYNNERPGYTPPEMMYKTVSVMFSDSLDPAANVSLSNIIILSYDNTLTMPPTTAPTPHPTLFRNVNTLTATEMETTEIIQTMGDADTYLIEVDIYVYYGNNSQFDTETVETIKTIIKTIFGYNHMNINTSYTPNILYLNTETAISNKANVTVLIAYLKHNLTRDLITHIPTLNIVQVKFQITIKEIYITSDSDDDNRSTKNNRYFSSFLPYDNDTIIISIMAAILLCLCSFILCICSWYKYCSLKYKNRYCSSNVYKTNRKSLPKHEKVPTMSFDDIKIRQELQRLSHSLSVNNSGVSVEEVSLGTHILTANSEGINTKHISNSLYERIEMNIQPMDDDDTTATDDQLIYELTTDNFSHKVNMNEHIKSNSNLDTLINEQIRATNRYSNHETGDNDNDIDDLDDYNDSSDISAMYDEGLSHINTTNGQHTPKSPDI